MPKTPIGGFSSYASPADFLARVDVSVPGLLCRDDDSQASATELLTDPNLATALQDASGIVESTILQAEMYTVADLQALPVGSNSLNLLKRIICGLALGFLRQRRGIMEQVDYPIYTQAVAYLDALQEGTKIFAFAETADAGVVDVSSMTDIDWYSLPLTTNQGRYWGTRSNRRYNQLGFGGGSQGNGGCKAW
jgi:hypothetical protein